MIIYLRSFALAPVSNLPMVRTITFVGAGLGTTEIKVSLLRITDRPTAMQLTNRVDRLALQNRNVLAVWLTIRLGNNS